MLENDFKKKIIARLKKLPNQKELWYFIKEERAVRGIPDLFVAYEGTMYVLEIKKDKKEVYDRHGNYKTKGRIALQHHNIRKARAAGLVAHFIYPQNFDEIFMMLEV